MEYLTTLYNSLVGSEPTVVPITIEKVIEPWKETLVSMFDTYPLLACGIAGFLMAFIAILMHKCLFASSRESPKEESPKQESDNESDDESDDEYVYAPGKSTLEIIEIYTKVLEKFPDIANAQLASGGLPDIGGPSTSDVDLLLITDNTTGFENSFGDHLIQIKAASESKPDRTVYTIRLEGYNRNINIYATNNPNNTDSVLHRDNEVLLNGYHNLQQVAIWHKMFGKDENGEPLTTEEAWARTLCLQGNAYDRMAQSSDKIKAIADLMEPELQDAFIRI